jgi:asparagine N-glycosylation enzyme membrane subunit Stt3
MIVVPVFLSRTIAGIPEKESAGFFFMFFALYLFLKAWKSENLRNSIILGILAGIGTACLGLIWGGVIYVFISIAIVSLVAFLLNKVHKKELITYFLWVIFSYGLMLLFSTRFSLRGLITSPTNGLPFVVFFIFLVHFILWGTFISKKGLFKKINLSEKTISLIVAVILGVILMFFILGPSGVIGIIRYLNNLLISPITGRWGQTVAENRQPYFTEWGSSFGPFIKNVPILFWLFFVGSVVLFKNMLNKIKKKDAWILTGLYILFFLGLVFSRYAPHPYVLNGENFISKLFYFGSALLLVGFFIYYSWKYYKNKDNSFDKINFSLLFLFSLFIICLISVRSAVRLIMVLAPIAVIFVGYLIVAIITKFKQTKDETFKIVMGALVILILLLSFFVFFGNIITKTPGFYQQIKSQAYSFVPSAYNQQWQKAMQWVGDETPKNAVFSHWWDYGYWVQSIGERATVLDGGNAISYWNYLMGRLVLTGDNQDDALEFLYNHNATHLLIDSSDIGKYGAFSSIGSDKELDRYSWMAAFLLDEKQTQETQNQTILVYPGGLALDEDLIIEQDGKEILLPGGGAGIGAIIIPTKKITGNETNFEQPYIIVVYQGQQHKVNLRYLAIQGGVIDFESGIEASVYIFPTVIVQGAGVNSNPIGAAIYLSPRLMRGMLSQVYILNDPFKNFPNFKLVHSEPNLIVDSLNQQGMNLPEFVYYQGIQGPIKIWEIEYTGKEEVKQEYLDTDATKYLDWAL